MKNIFIKNLLGVYCWSIAGICYAADKFDILPDLPEPLANAAQASSVSTIDSTNSVTTQTVGSEPNFVSTIFSLIFVILLIYATGILYSKLNKFGLNAFKKNNLDSPNSHVSVISTTPLGTNKTLHVVELEGKRMLIGASSNSIHLIKDLGSCAQDEIEGEYSKIEIPNIRIPRIEIPKIEFPGFTKVMTKSYKSKSKVNIEDKIEEENINQEENDDFEISEIYEENSDGIIDNLFHTVTKENEMAEKEEQVIEHKVDPDEFALYKKYL